jgi:hypothetical protein
VIGRPPVAANAAPADGVLTFDDALTREAERLALRLE